MGLTAHELADLSGVSVRTLHYYEEQGLLAPERRPNGYRDYSPADVRRLQHVLLYRQADMPLSEIRRILNAPADVQAAALRGQLERLRVTRAELDEMIATVERMVDETCTWAPHHERSGRMASKHTGAPQRTFPTTQDFEAFKQQAIEENERTWGAETRATYGNEAVDASKNRVASMDEREWSEADQQARDIASLLAEIASGDDVQAAVLGEAGHKLCALHRAWLLHYWTPAMYSPQAHQGLAQAYVADERFTATYEAMAPGGARILHDAITTWAGRLDD